MSWPVSCGVGPEQVASFKGLAAEGTCLGLCPVAWGAIKGLRKVQVKILPRRTRIPRQTASFKAAQNACPGLCPVA